MAGHSKWANIRARKGAQDAKRGKLFTKLIREITTATRTGGGADSNSNSRLRLALDKAFANNMTKDTVERAIKRGLGPTEGEQFEDIIYEGYGPGGVAVMVECMTDNRNRTVAEVRHAFTKCGGQLGTTGSVSYLFSKQGRISFGADVKEDQILDIALNAGAEDINISDDGTVEIMTSPEHFMAVNTALEQAKFKPEEAAINQVATTEVVLDKDSAEKMIKLLEMLEDLDDVQEVFSNANIPDDILKSLA